MPFGYHAGASTFKLNNAEQILILNVECKNFQLAMSENFFTLLIDDEIVRFEKNRIITIEPYEFGTKITLEASHVSEEPFIYFTREEYSQVMKSYLS